MKGGRKLNQRCADRNDCHSPPNWMSFLKLHRERASERAKLESNDQHMAAINTHISLLESLGRLVDSEAFSSCWIFFVVLLFGCFPGAAITHLPSDRLNQISVLRFCFLFFLGGCYNILCSDWSVRQCSGKASFREPWWVFTPARPR